MMDTEEANDDIESPNIDIEEVENQDNHSNETDKQTSSSTEIVNLQKQRQVRLPLSRIKSIMKMDPSCALTSQDSVFLITKATELFIEYVTKEASKQTLSGKRKTIMKRDLDIAIDNNSRLCFLDGAIS